MSTVIFVDSGTKGDSEISGFRLGVDEVFAFRDWYAVYVGSSLSTFRGSLSVPSSRFKHDGTNRLSRNFCKQLQTYATLQHRKAKNAKGYYFRVQRLLSGFSNREEMCLLRNTTSAFKSDGG